MKLSFFWSLIYLGVVFSIALAMMVVSHLIGPKRLSGKKLYPYESGMDLADDSRKKINIKFYLVATLFILLDIEVLFLIPWAVNFKSMIENSDIMGVIDMLIFMILVVVLLYYIVKKRVLHWEEY